MYFPGYDPGSRYRRRASETKRRTTATVISLIVVAGLGYWYGGEVIKSGEAAYKQQAILLKDENKRLEDSVTQLRTQVETLQIHYKQLEQRYTAEVPTGDLKTLSDLAREQLSDGIAAQRLAFVIQSARPPRNCSEAQQKRFVVKTPSYKGPDSAVSFGNGLITVTAEGTAAIGASGNAEAWYDPSKPVKVRMIQIGGKEIIKEQLLPIHHSIVIGNKEYRFTVAAGDRSFISVTSDSCDYP